MGNSWQWIYFISMVIPGSTVQTCNVCGAARATAGASVGATLARTAASSARSASKRFAISSLSVSITLLCSKLAASWRAVSSSRACSRPLVAARACWLSRTAASSACSAAKRFAISCWSRSITCRCCSLVAAWCAVSSWTTFSRPLFAEAEACSGASLKFKYCMPLASVWSACVSFRSCPFFAPQLQPLCVPTLAHVDEQESVGPSALLGILSKDAMGPKR